MTDFPMDVVVGILSRIPVKPLLRFRCVSKQFRAIIDSHAFIRLHLKRSMETKNHLSLIVPNNILCSVDLSKIKISLRSLDLDSLGRVEELSHPFESKDSSITKVWGYCHGLVCLGNTKGDLVVWNPWTRKSQELPSIKIDFPDSLFLGKNISYGFGYDSVSDDYKVVRFVQLYNQPIADTFASEVKVYNMKSNSWRSIQDFPYWFRDYQSRGVLIGSALHWVVSRKPLSDIAKFIVAFDLAAEDYQLLPLPEYFGEYSDMHLVELGGCLCTICTCKGFPNDIWVMKDYRVNESWSKLFSVAPPPQAPEPFKFLVPLAYSKSGFEVLLIQGGTKLFWYDINRKRIKTTKTCANGGSVVCMESLVPLSGGGEKYAK
ncbi:hypothetical protein Vadar_009875 [Vaccinium darrowii]|uniref:Uncharacterized protein n=1 Tax=Vaccinium darrowii TaxID=229202 RepID=A0ACB7X9R4_9ERIC|nr:hypothetical protein Vadar_009875 [Vaccinium darrowii]